MSKEYILNLIDTHFPGEQPVEPDLYITIEHFIKQLGTESVEEAFRIALKKQLSRTQTIKYMFGILWNILT